MECAPVDSKTRTTTSTRRNVFFRVFSKNTFFTGKMSTVIFVRKKVKPGYHAPRSPLPPPQKKKKNYAGPWIISLPVLVLVLEAKGPNLEGRGPLQPSLWICPWEIFFLPSVSQFFCLTHSVAFYFSSLQCKKFRDKVTPDKRKIFKEKLQASEVFKDKKSSYPLTWVARILINAYFEHWESLVLMLYKVFSLTWAASR